MRRGVAAIAVLAIIPTVVAAGETRTASREAAMNSVPEITISIQCAVFNAALDEHEAADLHLDQAERSLVSFISELQGCPGSALIDANNSSWVKTTSIMSRGVDFCLGRLFERETSAFEHIKESTLQRPDAHSTYSGWLTAVADFTRSESQRLSCDERVTQ